MAKSRASGSTGLILTSGDHTYTVITFDTSSKSQTDSASISPSSLIGDGKAYLGDLTPLSDGFAFNLISTASSNIAYVYRAEKDHLYKVTSIDGIKNFKSSSELTTYNNDGALVIGFTEDTNVGTTISSVVIVSLKSGALIFRNDDYLFGYQIDND